MSDIVERLQSAATLSPEPLYAEAAEAITRLDDRVTVLSTERTPRVLITPVIDVASGKPSAFTYSIAVARFQTVLFGTADTEAEAITAAQAAIDSGKVQQ